jgi:hypothetical protein
MLAEKFFLVLETLISRTNPDFAKRGACEHCQRFSPLR